MRPLSERTEEALGTGRLELTHEEYWELLGRVSQGLARGDDAGVEAARYLGIGLSVRPRIEAIDLVVVPDPK